MNLIIVPHFDDEVLIAFPFLNAECEVVFTHPFDFVEESPKNRYCGLWTSRDFSNEMYEHTKLNILEGIIRNSKEPVQIITTSVTAHPSHKACREIVGQLLRMPFTMKISRVLEAPPMRDSFTWDTEVSYDVIDLHWACEKYMEKITSGYFNRYISTVANGFTFNTVYKNEVNFEAL